MSTWKSDSFIRTGHRHIEKSVSCQDFVLLADSRGAALSDGVSRSINPEKASEAATKAALDVCQTMSQNPKWMKDLLRGGESRDKALKGLSEIICKRVRENLMDYPRAEATLCFVYLLNKRYAVAGYIGDSAAIIISDKKAELLTQRRDYGGATESIAHPKAASLMDIRLIDMEKDNVKAFVLTSDGLEQKLYMKGKSSRVLKSCEQYVNAMFTPDSHKRIEKMLDDVTADKCFDDDISLAILARDKVSLTAEPTWLCSCGHRTHLPITRCTKCGKDFYNLFRNANMTGFSSPWEFFTYLNSHPEEELMVIKNLTESNESENKAHHNASEVNPSEYDDTSVICIHGDGVQSHSHNSKKPESGKAPTRNTVHRAKNTEEANRKAQSPRSVVIPKQSVVMLSIVVVLLLLSLMISFLQIMTLSHKVGNLEEEIDELRAAYSTYEAQTAKEETSTPGEAAFPETEATQEATLSSTEATEEILESTASETAETVPDDPEPKAEIRLSVSGVTTLFAEPSYTSSVTGYATPDTSVRLISDCEVDDIKWVRVEVSPDYCGWAPNHLFSAAQSQPDTNPSPSDTTSSPSDITP